MKLTYERARTILGVSQPLTPEELKTAFRKMAMHYHPDRENGDEEKFKELKDAYEFLSKSPIHNFVEEAEITKSIDITLEEAFKGKFGKVVEIEIDGKSQTLTFDIEQGTAHRDYLIPSQISDYHFIANIICPKNIKVDWGFKSKSSLGDITTEIEVCPFKMMTGGYEVVETLCGSAKLRILPGQKPNQLMKIQGKGFWKNRDRNLVRGDLYVRVIPKIKKIKDLTSEDILIMKKIISEVENEKSIIV